MTVQQDPTKLEEIFTISLNSSAIVIAVLFSLLFAILFVKIFILHLKIEVVHIQGLQTPVFKSQTLHFPPL